MKHGDAKKPRHMDAARTQKVYQQHVTKALRRGDATGACSLLWGCKSLRPALRKAIIDKLQEACPPNHRPTLLPEWREAQVVKEAEASVAELRAKGHTREEAVWMIANGFGLDETTLANLLKKQQRRRRVLRGDT